MKRLIALISIATLSAAGFSQIQDTLTDPPPRELSQPEAKYNVSQPRISLVGRRVVLRTKMSESTLNETSRAAIEQAIQDVGADPVWDDDELQSEHDRREALRGNADVDQTTIPTKGTLQAHDLVAEVGVAMLAGGQQSLDVFLGTFLRGFGFSFSGEATATIISVKFIDRATGSTRGLPIMKVANVTKSTDHLGVDIVGGLLRDRLGVEYNSEDSAARDQRSFDGAVRKLAAVLKWRYGQK